MAVTPPPSPPHGHISCCSSRYDIPDLGHTYYPPTRRPEHADEFQPSMVYGHGWGSLALTEFDANDGSGYPLTVCVDRNVGEGRQLIQSSL